MKNVIPFILLFACACGDDGVDPNQPGCVTGDYIHDDKSDRVVIGCGTKSQYYNFAVYHVDYIDVQWAPVDNCSECK